MRNTLVVAAWVLGSMALFSAEPLQPKYKVGERVPILYEYRVTGATQGQSGALVFKYFYQPFAAIYCRHLDEQVLRLLKKIDETTAKHSTPKDNKRRLGSYLVLLCDNTARHKELQALAEKEKIQHTILSLGTTNEGTGADAWRAFNIGLGEAETTVLLAGPPRASIKASYAFRKGELKDKEIDRILADLTKVLSADEKSKVQQDSKPASILGTWKTIDRHLALGSLYQPVHGVRKREGIVHFRQEGDRLSGCAIHADHAAITHQQRWKDGCTEFRQVSFAGDKLTFEWDIAEWFKHAGPLAVEQGRLANQGTIRVVATLKGDRLAGQWGMFLADGSEAFRGEWEAVRAPEPGPLLLIGGRHQDLPDDVRDLFFKLAGEKARIVVIPTAVADPEGTKPDDYLKPPRDLKPLSFQILHTRDRKTANDPAFVKPLTEATAVFLTNGHRHRIFDAYRGTLVEKELKKLHARGGLIAGTGRGAFVLGELVSNRPGAEQLTEPGFGLLPGFLLDEGEKGRLAEAVAANPAYVGLTIDYGTAVEIRGKNMRVLGNGAVTIRLAKGAGQEAKVDTLKAAARLDLVELRRAVAARAKESKKK